MDTKLTPEQEAKFWDDAKAPLVAKLNRQLAAADITRKQIAAFEQLAQDARNTTTKLK